MHTSRGQPLPRRAHCPRCERPQRTCLCDLIVAVDHPVPVLVLQHPLEARQAKGSLPLLQLSLARCRVVVGEHFEPGLMAHWLQATAAGPSVLVYPDVPAAPARQWADPAGPVGQLVLLDATWRKSLKLLLDHPALQALPRLPLAVPESSAYGRWRLAPRAGQCATLEAACQALAALPAGQRPATACGLAQLQRQFARWVQRMAAHAVSAPATCRTNSELDPP